MRNNYIWYCCSVILYSARIGVESGPVFYFIFFFSIRVSKLFLIHLKPGWCYFCSFYYHRNCSLSISPIRHTGTIVRILRNNVVSVSNSTRFSFFSSYRRRQIFIKMLKLSTEKLRSFQKGVIF